MSKFQNWQKAKAERQAAEDWLDNKYNVDSQTDRYYSLRVTGIAAEYCGQAYAGADSYHYPPKEFKEHLVAAIKKHFDLLAKDALQMAKDKEQKLAVESKREVQAMLEEIAEVEQ